MKFYWQSCGWLNEGGTEEVENTTFETESVSDNVRFFAGEDEDDDKALQVVVRMYVVQPKSLRACNIAFDPPKEANKSLSILTQDSLSKS